MKLKLNILLIVFLSSSAFVWSGGQAAEGSGAEKLEISWFGLNNRGVLLPEDSVSELYIEERYNVELLPWYETDMYQKDQRNLRMASGDIPDFMKIGPQGSLSELGAVRELPKEMLYAHMPKYIAVVDEIDSEAAWAGVNVDGKNMGIPGVNVAVSSGVTMVTRRDWMEAVGVEIPKKKMLDYHYADDWSLDDIEELLLKYVNDDPDGNGKKDTYGVSNYSGNSPSWAGAWDFFANEFGAFGVRIHSWQDVNGKLSYTNIWPEYRDALSYLNGWYEKGIIDPEIVSDGRAEFNRKYTNNIVGAFEQTSAWTGPRTQGPVGLLLAANPDAEPVYFVGFAGPDGKRGTVNRPSGGFGSVSIGANTSDEKAIRIMQILDDVQADMEVYHKVTKGDEGVHYSIDNDGLMVINKEFGTAEAITNMGWMYFTMWNVITPDITLSRFPRWRMIPHRIGKENGYQLDAGFRPNLNEKFRSTEGELKSIENEFFWKAILGEIDIDKEWDGYVASWKKNGGDELTEEVNRQRDGS